MKSPLATGEGPLAPGLAAFAVAGPDLAATLQGLWEGAIGRTVRCVPTRRTVAVSVEGGWLFAKWRDGGLADARAEWRWLHELPALGLNTPAPVAWIASGRRSMLVTKGATGRSFDAWILEAAAGGWGAELAHYAARCIAPLVRRLHDHHLVYRDLYWNHIFVGDPRRFDPPVFLDVERVFRPRWRWRRWVVKDLAGLRASVPASVVVTPRHELRFLRAYAGGSLRGLAGLCRAIRSKAARIGAHAPRFG